ncbi:MAG: hypothetical protein QXX68_02660 [Candidatus Pacearchaeota archaeon]
MNPGDYIYAIVSYYKNPRKKGFKAEERIVRVGTREEDIVVNNFYLFKDSSRNRVLRMEFHSRDNGGIWASIEDSFENKRVFSFIPLDSLVGPSEVVAPN